MSPVSEVMQLIQYNSQLKAISFSRGSSPPQREGNKEMWCQKRPFSLKSFWKSTAINIHSWLLPCYIWVPCNHVDKGSTEYPHLSNPCNYNPPFVEKKSDFSPQTDTIRVRICLNKVKDRWGLTTNNDLSLLKHSLLICHSNQCCREQCLWFLMGLRVGGIWGWGRFGWGGTEGEFDSTTGKQLRAD